MLRAQGWALTFDPQPPARLLPTSFEILQGELVLEVDDMQGGTDTCMAGLGVKCYKSCTGSVTSSRATDLSATKRPTNNIHRNKHRGNIMKAIANNGWCEAPML